MSITNTSDSTSITQIRPSVCNSIRENMQLLNLDEKICCGTDNDCLNVKTRCYGPDRLVRCHEISKIDACERRHRNNSGSTTAVKEICKKENLAKRLCISTDSVNNPDLDEELEWIVNRPFRDSNTEYGASCRTCVCCNGKMCSRIFGKNVFCGRGCPNDLTMLNQKCLDVFKAPTEFVKVADCTDMFEPGNCQFYNFSTGNLVELKDNSKLFFQPEVCDFTVKPPLLDMGDKIALGTSIGLGAPGFIVTVFCAWIAWKHYKRDKKMGQLQTQESQSLMISVEGSETENQTEDVSNSSSTQLLKCQIPPKCVGKK